MDGNIDNLWVLKESFLNLTLILGNLFSLELMGFEKTIQFQEGKRRSLILLILMVYKRVDLRDHLSPEVNGFN